MKFTKSLAAILICGSFVVINCDVAEAAQSTESAGISSEKISDLNKDSLQIEELTFGPGRRRPYPPPPPPPPPGHHRPHGPHPGHHYPPPPPPPPGPHGPHPGHMPPPPPPHHGW